MLNGIYRSNTDRLYCCLMKHNHISHTINFILFTSFTAIFGYTTPLSVSSSIHLYRRKWIHENIAGSIWEQRIVGFKLFFQGLDARNSSYCSRTSFTAWFRTTTSESTLHEKRDSPLPHSRNTEEKLGTQHPKLEIYLTYTIESYSGSGCDSHTPRNRILSRQSTRRTEESIRLCA